MILGYDHKYEIVLSSTKAYSMGVERVYVWANFKSQAIEIAKEKYGIDKSDIYVISEVY